jgi:hypothetical protein
LQAADYFGGGLFHLRFTIYDIRFTSGSQ